MTCRDLGIYASRLLKSPLSSIDNVILSPPGSRNCYVLNKKSKHVESFKISVPTDWWTVSQVYVDQDYSIEHLARYPELRSLFDRRQKQGKKSLILDAGANIGASARFLQSKWPGARLWCIEPSERNVQLAKENLAGSDAHIMHAALGDHDGYCGIANVDALPNSFRVDSDKFAPDSACRMFSMKTLLAQASEANLFPFVLKIDIEGFESEVFKDANEWLYRWPLLMIELHDWMLPECASSSNVLAAISAGQRDVILRGNTLISFANPLAQ